MTDYTRKYGPAAIGARLRRLSESIDEDAGRIYAELGIDFQQRWVGILEHLSGQGAQSVGGLALALGIRHSSVSQTRRSLEEAGLVESDPDPNDGRSRLLRLSAGGKRLVRRLRPLWKVLNATSLELDQEADGLIGALDRLDAALQRVSLYDRVRQKLS
ncbi:MAG TPA: MarR family transcriptional regulator [Steroidobacteraceae bacterium]|nr:MarR family transcriptional regulator [Steroidobacteraceae bacterium]